MGTFLHFNKKVKWFSYRELKYLKQLLIWKSFVEIHIEQLSQYYYHNYYKNLLFIFRTFVTKKCRLEFKNYPTNGFNRLLVDASWYKKYTSLINIRDLTRGSSRTLLAHERLQRWLSQIGLENGGRQSRGSAKLFQGTWPNVFWPK